MSIKDDTGTMRGADPPRPATAVLFVSFASVPKNGEAATARQRELGQHRADELDLRLAHEIVEMGAAALPFERRLAFQALLNYLDDHPDVRYVMFPSLGRISRSFRNLHLILKEFDARGIRLVTFDGQVSNSAEVASRIESGTKALIAQQSVGNGNLKIREGNSRR